MECKISILNNLYADLDSNCSRRCLINRAVKSIKLFISLSSNIRTWVRPVSINWLQYNINWIEVANIMVRVSHGLWNVDVDTCTIRSSERQLHVGERQIGLLLDSQTERISICWGESSHEHGLTCALCVCSWNLFVIGIRMSFIDKLLNKYFTGKWSCVRWFRFYCIMSWLNSK